MEAAFYHVKGTYKSAMPISSLKKLINAVPESFLLLNNSGIENIAAMIYEKTLGVFEFKEMIQNPATSVFKAHRNLISNRTQWVADEVLKQNQKRPTVYDSNGYEP